MAVKFTEKSFTIEVVTEYRPVEVWLETCEEMIDVLQCQDDDMISRRFHFLEVLRAMLPDLETAEKMGFPRLTQK